jgi:DDE superfamily endonuclease/Homeodomain-like domain
VARPDHLATADGCGTAEIMRRSGKAKPVVWRWQARFMEQGVDGLLRDKTRKPGKPPLPAATVQKVVDLVTGPPPGETTHWTGRMLAKAVGISLRSVQRILEAHHLAPHRIRTFKLSNDPKFADKLRDVVGLYVDPPAHAVVLSVDEKSQIQALDHTQPGLPMKPGRAGTMTHDYKRNGTTTLFAALNVLDGTIIGRNMKRHRHQEFIRFLNEVDAHVPKRKAVHAIVDNYATHRHPKVRKWLAQHPRWTFHFTPTSASWLNAVEGFFAKLTNRRLKRGAFRSVAELLPYRPPPARQSRPVVQRSPESCVPGSRRGLHRKISGLSFPIVGHHQQSDPPHSLRLLRARRKRPRRRAA